MDSMKPPSVLVDKRLVDGLDLAVDHNVRANVRQGRDEGLGRAELMRRHPDACRRPPPALDRQQRPTVEETIALKRPVL